MILVCLPLYLAMFSAPTRADALMFAFALGPLVAAIHVSRTGRILAGHNICIASILLLSCGMLASGDLATSTALIFLALAPIEAAIAASAVSLLVAAGGALVITAAALVLKATGIIAFSAQATDMNQTMAAMLAIAYCTCLGAGAIFNAEFQGRLMGSKQIGFRSLSETIGDLVLRMDKTGAVVFASGNSQELFGLSQRELTGRGLFDRVHVGDRPAFLKAVSDAAMSSTVVTVTLRVRMPAGAGAGAEPHFRWIELRVNNTQHNASEGELKHENDCGHDMVIAVARDVTQVKLYQEQLQSAKCDADQANVWKDRFLANVSHELRTPLNAIIGFSEILATESIAPKDPLKAREYAQIIKESGEHLLAVVNSILDISKIEAGSFDLLPEEFEVAPLIENCIDMLKLRAESGSVSLLREVHASAHELVADKRALKQVIINLLSNAIKFTPEFGTVSIGMRPEGNSMLLWVKDSGIGIKESELGRIGNPFFQAVDSYDRPYEGTGLGLSVVRGLVGLHGGTIKIESGPGVGTSVTIKLPLDCRQVKAGSPSSAVIEAIPLPAAKAGPADFSLGQSNYPVEKEVRKIA